MPPSRVERYGAISQALHWITAVLVLTAFIYGPGGPEDRIYAASADGDRRLHETLGVTVLLLSVLRLAWRAWAPRPAPEPGPDWMIRAARIVQGLLYALLFIVPLSAITGVWLEGHPLTLLGGLGLAPALATRHELGEVVAEAHGWLGDVILWTAGAHALAGLLHHAVLKDDVLATMLPRWLLRSRRPGPGDAG